MQRHHSLGTATLVALMAAHREVDKRNAVQPLVTFREEVIRALSRLEDDFTLVHNTGLRIGRAPPMVAKPQLRQ